MALGGSVNLQPIANKNIDKLGVQLIQGKRGCCVLRVVAAAAVVVVAAVVAAAAVVVVVAAASTRKVCVQKTANHLE